MAESVLIDIIGRDRASAAFDSAARGATRAASKIDTVAGKMTRAGATMTRKLTVPIVAVGVASEVLAVKWQKSMTLLQTAGGETADKVHTIGKGIQKTATDTGTSLSNLNEGMYIAAKADHKWKAVDQLKVLHAVAEGAKTENVDLGLAMTAQTSIMQSYGLGASQAVSVQNQLIKGAGLAKTTYAEYAASLSNVVPLASQLHISFAQVSGAIDTMTQHGDSAQRATDDLNNLIRNLAGQNNVASGAMQQLGINTVDLSKHLGERGLTGTLAIVRKALQQHTKNGMIVTDVHKAAALATKSLNEELGAMAPQVRKQSKELLNGSTNIKDYTKYAKSMGGDSGAQALQFLALYKSAKGFNDQLKSGNGVVKTSAAEMLKLLGGSTAMNTALMLGVGNGREAAASQKLFGQSVAEVAKAAKLGGADVLGWAETQNTMAVKAGRTKAELEVLGVEIGSALIPVVGKLTGYVRDGVHWWESLGSGWHKVIGYAALFVAALGPVLTIGGRLFTLYKVIATASGKVAGAFRGTGAAAATASTEIATAEAEQTRVIVVNSERQIAALSSVRAYQRRQALAGGVGGGGVVPMGGAGTAAEESTARRGILARMGGGGMAGFGAGLGLTALGGAVNDGGRGYRHVAGSVLEGAGTGALLGSVAGPWGAAAGGAIGGGLAFAKQLTAGTYKVPFSNADTKALAKLKEFVAVEKSGRSTVSAFATALVAGGPAMKTNLRDVAAAVTAHSKLAESADAAGLSTKDLSTAITGSQGAYNKVMDYWQKSGQLTEDDVTAMRALRDQYQQGKQVAQKYADAHGLVIDGQMKEVRQSTFLSGAIGNLNAAHLTGRQVGTLFRGELDNLRTSLKENGATLDAQSGFGQRNIAVVRELTARALQHAQAVYQQTGSLSKADQAFQRDKTSIEKVGTAAGLQKGAVDAIVTSIGNVKSKHVRLNVDTTAARDALTSFGGWYDGYLAQLSNKKIPAPQVTGLPGGVLTVPGGLGAPPHKKAAGGAVLGAGTETSDSIAARLSNGEHVWTASDVRKAGGQGAVYRLRSLVQAGVLHFAKGGAVSSKLKGDASAVGTAIGQIGAQYSPPFDLSQTGIARVNLQIKHAQDVLGDQIRKGLKASTIKHLRAEIADLRAQAQKQLAALKVKITHADTSALTTALRGSVDEARTAFGQMIADARAAGLSSAQVARITSAESSVLRKMGQRDSIDARLGQAPTASTAYDRLQTARDNYSGVQGSGAQAITGAFDITSAGLSGSTILGRLKSLVAKAKPFAAAIGKLAKAGLPPALLQQLEQAGPAALTEANGLLASGIGTIHEIASQYGQLTGAGSEAGKYVADAMYGSAVSSAQSYVNGLLSQKSAINKAITSIVGGTLSKLRAELHVASSAHGAHQSAASHHKGSTSHESSHSTGHGGKQLRPPAYQAKGVTIHELHIHDQHDPVAAANATVRRLAHLGSA